METAFFVSLISKVCLWSVCSMMDIIVKNKKRQLQNGSRIIKTTCRLWLPWRNLYPHFISLSRLPICYLNAVALQKYLKWGHELGILVGSV